VKRQLDRNRRLEKIVRGALRDTIKVHGPITKNYIGSAMKRIFGQLQVTEDNGGLLETIERI